MKSFILSGLTAALVLVSVMPGYGQQNYATNVQTEISEDKMLITYDTPTHDGTPYYSIILMITYNGKTIPANSVYGDFGNKIEPGTEKAITWYYTNDFKEDIRKVSVSVFAYKMNEPKVYFEIVSKSNKGFAPCEIRVTNGSSNVNEYKWDFGDPASGINNHSTEKEPVHVFDHGGVYKISLVGRNSVLGLESTSFNSIEIKEYEPTVADFNFETRDSKPPYEVKFTNSSKNADIFSWNFGDTGAGAKNNSSDKSNPSYKYKQAGTYQVKLTVKSSISGFSDQITKEVTIKAPLNPAAGFVFRLSQESAPAIVQFKNTSTNSTSFKWNFGDAGSGSLNTSDETDPAHTYSKAGKFEVVLTASNPQTGKSNTFTGYVTIQGPPQPPVAGFKIGNNNAIAPVTINFTNTSTNADRYTWDFGDPGSGNKNGSRDISPVHTYENPGRYTVVLNAASSKSNETSQFTDFVTVVEVARTPVASFTIENNNSVVPALVKFKNSSVNASSYSWDFGDSAPGSNTSAESNPSHTYNKAGKYKVTLTVKNSSGAVNTFSDNVVVTEPLLSPVAGFESLFNGQYAPIDVSFTNKSENADVFKWSFGDSQSTSNESSMAEPAHRFDKPGNYTITLEAKNTKSGKLDRAVKEIMIPEKPNTFLKTFGKKNSDEIILSLLSIPNSQYIALINEQNNSTTFVTFDSKGMRFSEKKISGNILDMAIRPNNKGYFLAGIIPPDDITVHLADNMLNPGQPIIVYSNTKDPGFSFSTLYIALSKNNELGIVANLSNGEGESNIWFLKTNSEGNPVDFKGKTFRYVGLKTASQLISSIEGGFALTGSYRDDKNASKEIMLGIVGNDGVGKMHIMRSKQSITGCDLIELPNGNYNLLTARESPDDKNFSEINLKLVNNIIEPLNCEIDLIGKIRTADASKFPPRVLATKDGYVILSHVFNGTDSDLTLYFIDKSGAILLRKEVIKRPGNQFGTCLMQESDGSLIIGGAELMEKDYDALIIRTDPTGKYTDSSGLSGKSEL